MSKLSRAATLLLVTAALASAEKIVFKGAPTGVNDGKYYVLPYELTIDGVTQLVDCFDVFDEVSVNETYTASILTLTQAAVSGFFTSANDLAQYEEVAWLSSQAYTGTTQQIGLQYAIWNVFGSAPQTTAAVTYENAAATAAGAGYTGFSFDSFRVIQQAGAMAGQPGTVQAFIYSVPASHNQQTTPEPGTVWMLAGALVSLALGSRYRRIGSRVLRGGSLQGDRSDWRN